MANNMMEWYRGVPAAPVKPHSTKPLSILPWARSSGALSTPNAKPLAGQAFDGSFSNWGTPQSGMAFNSTAGKVGNPAVMTGAYAPNGVQQPLSQANAVPTPPASILESVSSWGNPMSVDHNKDPKYQAFLNSFTGGPEYLSTAPRISFDDSYAADQAKADEGFFAGMPGVATNPMNAMASAAPAAQPWYNSGMFEGMLGTKDAPGWGGMALGTANSLLSGYMGMKQYGLAKDSFDESKKQFWSNFNIQKDLTNNDITDRNIARNASREGSTNPYVDTKRIA